MAAGVKCRKFGIWNREKEKRDKLSLSWFHSLGKLKSASLQTVKKYLPTTWFLCSFAYLPHLHASDQTILVKDNQSKYKMSFLNLGVGKLG